MCHNLRFQATHLWLICARIWLIFQHMTHLLTNDSSAGAMPQKSQSYQLRLPSCLLEFDFWGPLPLQWQLWGTKLGAPFLHRPHQFLPFLGLAAELLWTFQNAMASFHLKSTHRSAAMPILVFSKSKIALNLLACSLTSKMLLQNIATRIICIAK